MYSSKKSMDLLRSSLSVLPGPVLSDILCGYAEFNPNFWMHLQTAADIQSKNNSSVLSRLIDAIDRTYGRTDLPSSLSYEQRSQFTSINELLRMSLNAGMAAETICAIEQALKYPENIAGVSCPDSFSQDCYDPLLELWLKAHKALGVSDQELASKLSNLIGNDSYSIFSCIEDLLEGSGWSKAKSYLNLGQVSSA